MRQEGSQQWTLTNGVLARKGKLEPISLILVDRIVVQDLDVHLPFLEIIRLDN